MSKTSKPRGPRLKVSVTKEILDRSVRANSRTCMIAEAVKEAFPDAKAVAVDLQTVRFTDPKRGLRYVYLTPRAGQKPLIEFDQGIDPEPFEMILRNAHVTRARGRKKAGVDDGLKKAATRINQDNSVSRVGGKAPPQMRTQRRFGIRAFRGSPPNSDDTVK